jgi:muramoyltetrapeptide carboxypeptidase
MKVDLEQDDSEHDLLPARDQFKAQALKPGAKVALIAPSSRPESPLALRKCIQTIEEMGYNPVPGASVLRYSGFTAGTDEQRIDDIHTFLQDDSIDALLCVSGGYGAARLLPLLDFALIRRHPKIILGGADNDTLLLAINKLTGLVVFHGQNLDEIEDEHSFNSLKNLLSGAEREIRINCRDDGEAPYQAASYSLSSEVREGVVCGGNLTALSSLFGTRYQPYFEDKILVLDDFAERNDILDRWFTTLYLAGVLTAVAGIAFGAFPNCGARGSNNMLSIEDTFGDRLKELGTPACFGFKFGRATSDNVLPIGVRAALDCGSGTLQMLETHLSG